MEYVKAFIVKLLIMTVLTFSIFGIFFHATIPKLILMTFIVTGITFLADVLLLPRMNQAVAAVGDFVVFFALYWGLGNLVVEAAVPLFWPALTAAYFGVMAEAIYHIYVMDRLYEPDRGAPVPVRYQTEFAEEEEVISKESKED